MAERLGDEAIDIMDVLNKPIQFSKGDSVGLVYPVYAWAPPEVVVTFARKLKAQEAFVYSICTYGGEPGNSMKILRKAIHLDSIYGLKMPSNYVIGMSVDSEDLAKVKIESAKVKIESIAEEVRNKVQTDDVVPGPLSGIKSTLAAAAFNKFGRTTKSFRITLSCNGCGLCEKVCPAKTIKLQSSKPVWGKSCFQCLACINRCPQQAIEYGKSSEGKGRYFFHEDV